MQGQPGPARRGGRPAGKIRGNTHYNPSVADPLDPISFVNKIHVPVFMACQWEDEQTGGHCPDLVQHFTGTSQKWFNFTNGAHIDSLDPYTYDHWYDFLQLFVAHQAPAMNPDNTRAASPGDLPGCDGGPPSDDITLPPDPIQSDPSYGLSSAAFEKLPQVRVLFDTVPGVTGGNLDGRESLSGLRATFSYLPGARHQRALVVLRPRRRAQRSPDR